jgi:hypothetical protein
VRYGRVVIVKGIEQGTAPRPDFRESERIIRLVVQQDEIEYRTDNLPHVTALAINVPWEEGSRLHVGQKAFLTLEIEEESVEKEMDRLPIFGGIVEEV